MHRALNATLFVLVSTLALAVPRAQTPAPIGDDLAVALNNHGVDPVTAPIAAAAIEIAVANNNKLLARIANLETNTALLDAEAGALLPGVQFLPADQVTTSSAAVLTVPFSDPQALDGKAVSLVAGQRYLYTFTTKAGSFTPFLRECNCGLSSLFNVPTLVHFEFSGVTSGAISSPLGQTYTTTFYAPSSFVFPGGQVSVTLVVDSMNTNGGTTLVDVVGVR